MKRFRYGSVFVGPQNRVVLTGRVPGLEEADTPHDFLLFPAKDGGWRYIGCPNVITGLVITSQAFPSVVAVTGDGLAREFDQDGETVTAIDAGSGGPNSHQWILDAAEIGSTLYVCGMANQVYRRRTGAAWTRFDEGIRTDEITGLKAIDGADESSIYAAGFGGQIWSSNGTEWTPEDSPTNTKLEAVWCCADGTVYAVGGMGTIIRGSRGRWSVIEHDMTEAVLWDVTVFQGTPYIAALDGLYRLEADDSVTPVSFDLGRRVSTGRVHCNEEVLWSVGREDLMVFDGRSWNVVEGPELPD